jgi:transposase
MLEERVPARHPLRKVAVSAKDALKAFDNEFTRLYAPDGRASIPPERLLRAALVQIFLSVRSERQLMDQMQYNLLFRWFVRLGMWAAPRRRCRSSPARSPRLPS